MLGAVSGKYRHHPITPASFEGASSAMRRQSWRDGTFAEGERNILEETAIAFAYNGSSYAVMMATPQDLEDFAVGFSLTEGIITSPDDIESLEIITQSLGFELRIRLREPVGSDFQNRRRFLAGPTGCGLCGIESLEQAMRAPRRTNDMSVYTATEIMSAMSQLGEEQVLNQATYAAHGAAFYQQGSGVVALREDVGRHSAFDKLAGSLARLGLSRGDGIGLITSRLSVELIQKAAAIGLPMIVAVSAPTSLAIRTADSAGMTLVAIARHDGFEIFSHPHRILNR